MGIIVSKNGVNARKIGKTAIRREGYLQEYIHNNPEALPLEDLKEDIHLLVVAREFPTKSGPIDALAIDADGDIYIIETKLFKNPDKRLVVAQVLDYGASLWHEYKDSNEVFELMDKTINSKFGLSLNEKLKDYFEFEDEAEVENLLENIRVNLAESRFRFVVLMDRLPSRLKNLISFINQNSRFDLFGCELDFYKYDEYEILIPNLYGAEAKKATALEIGASRRKKWDENAFLTDARSKLDPAALQNLERLYSFCKETADQLSFGTGPQRGSVNPKYSGVSIKSVLSLFSDGALRLNFKWLHDNDFTVSFRESLKTQLEKIEGFPKLAGYLEKKMEFPIDAWGEKVDHLISVLDNLLNGSKQMQGVGS